jgi:ribosome biogenesis GTPase / thiamine phosphate phosphatase
MSLHNIAPRLLALGWNAAREIESATVLTNGLQPARILAQHRDRYVVGTSDGDTEAVLRGSARLDATSLNTPAVGDWVSVRRQDDQLAVIVELLPRRSTFVRQSAGETTTPQVVAANIELALIATAVVGDLNPRRLERYAILAWESGATPVILLTKSDLASAEELAYARVAAAQAAPGVEIVSVSTRSGAGLEELSSLLVPGATAALIGSSGVGKSTLVNALLGAEHLRTRDVRDDGKGRHTTTHRELVRLASGALLIDTPGMRELQLWSEGDGLDTAFVDIVSLATECRFRDCAHAEEPDCAVQRAIELGVLDAARLESYRALRREVAWLATRSNALASVEAKRRVKVIHRAVNAEARRRPK